MSTLDITVHLPNLFDRPFEPLIKPRGNIVYEIPPELLDDRDKKYATSVHLKDITPPGCSKYSVPGLRDIPELIIQEIKTLDRYDNFNIFKKEHVRLAGKLINILLNAPDTDTFLATCVYAREKVNPHLFCYAVSVATLHRNDTRNIPLPSNVEIFPHKYFNSKIFTPAMEKLAMNVDESERIVEVPSIRTASDLDIEHRIAYWREDIFINLHHWHWHLVYPYSCPENQKIVEKDRRGELFFYMHEQIQARYNFERFSNHLARVRSLSNYRDPIPEGYYSKLYNPANGKDWASRQANSVMRDLKRENEKNMLNTELNHMERWRDRIFNDIMDKTLVRSNGETIDLHSEKENGIDHLGNLVEASDLSVNPGRYGDLHNAGHLMIGYIHDPDYRHLEESSVIADNSTTMRDPAFYAWHAHIDDIFQEYKETLTPYTEKELNFEGISIENIEVEVTGAKKNEFYTHWQKTDINMEKGMNYQPRGPIYARITHLQHKPFTYNIQVKNSGAQRTGTVRIFMAPTKSESKEEFLFKQQRRLFIELDKFTYDLKSGTNEIKRSSIKSTVTIPLEQMLQQGGDDFCKCGWPHHLLIPKGTTEGLEAKLFVMITNAADDEVKDVSGESKCKPAPSYCGLRGEKYPDKRAMGFPFDRRARDGVSKLDKFLTPNMKVRDVIIKFIDETITPDEPKNEGKNSGDEVGKITCQNECNQPCNDPCNNPCNDPCNNPCNDPCYDPCNNPCYDPRNDPCNYA